MPDPTSPRRSVRDHAADTPGGFTVIMALSALDRANAEYEFVAPGPATDVRNPDIGLSIGTEAFRALDRPGEIVVQVGSKAHYDRLLDEEAAAARPIVLERPTPPRPPAGDNELADVPEPWPGHALVILFKPSGKYYTSESWRIPTELTDEQVAAGASPADLLSPYAMRWSPDYRTIGGGAVLVPTQEPWGYPHLIVGGTS